MGIKVNERDWNIPKVNDEAERKWTGAELKQRWGIPHENKLYREREGNDKLVGDDDVEHIKDGNIYYDLPIGYCS